MQLLCYVSVTAMSEQWQCLASAIDTAQYRNLHHVTETFNKALGRMLIDAAIHGDDDCCTLLIKAGAPVDYTHENYESDCEAAHKVYLRDLEFYLLNGWSDFDEGLEYIGPKDWVSCKTCDRYKGTVRTGSSWADEDAYYTYHHQLRQADNALLRALTHGHNKCVQVLLDAGASFTIDLGRYDKFCHTNAVQRSMLANNIGGLKILLCKGFDVNDQHIVDRVVLSQSSLSCFALFLQHGLRIFSLSPKATSPIAIAAGFRGNKTVPEDCQEREQPYSLKYLSRTAIRGQILECSKRNLLLQITRENIGLPATLCRYLLFDETISRYIN